MNVPARSERVARWRPGAIAQTEKSEGVRGAALLDLRGPQSREPSTSDLAVDPQSIARLTATMLSNAMLFTNDPIPASAITPVGTVAMGK